MAYNDAMRALRELEMQQAYNKEAAMDNTIQRNLLSNPKALLGLVGARMAMRTAAVGGQLHDQAKDKAGEVAQNIIAGNPNNTSNFNFDVSNLGQDPLQNLTANNANILNNVHALNTSKMVPTTPYQEPGFLHGIFNEVTNPISDFAENHPLLLNAGLGAGTLSLLGMYGLKNRLGIQNALIAHQKDKTKIKNDPTGTSLFKLATGIGKRTPQNLARSATSLFMGAQTLSSLTGSAALSSAAMPLMAGSMALRSPMGALAIGAGLGDKLGLWNLAGHDAGLGVMSTGMANLPSMMGHTLASPFDAASSLFSDGGLANTALGGVGKAIGGAGDWITNLAAGSPTAAMITGVMSMMLAGKGINAGKNLLKNLVPGTNTKLLKSEKATVPQLRSSSNIRRQVSTTQGVGIAVRSAAAQGWIKPGELYQLTYLGAIASALDTLVWYAEQHDNEIVEKKAGANYIQNAIQGRYRETGNSTFDLNRPYDPTEETEYLAPEGTVTRWLQDKKKSFGESMLNAEESLNKFAIWTDPLNYVVGGASNPLTLLKEGKLNNTLEEVKKVYSAREGISMKTLDAENSSVSTIMNDAETVEEKQLALLSTMTILDQARNHLLRDIKKGLGIESKDSSANKLGELVDEVEARAYNLDKKEQAGMWSLEGISRLPLASLITAPWHALKTRKYKKQGKISEINEKFVRSVLEEHDENEEEIVNQTNDEGTIVEVSGGIETTNTILLTIADYLLQFMECHDCVATSRGGKITQGFRMPSNYSSADDTDERIKKEKEEEQDDNRERSMLASLKDINEKMSTSAISLGLGQMKKGGSLMAAGFMGLNPTALLAGLAQGLFGAAVSGVGWIARLLGPALMTPWGVGIAAALISGYLIYENWEDIKEVMSDTWKVVKDKWEYIKDKWENFKFSDMLPWNWEWNNQQDYQTNIQKSKEARNKKAQIAESQKIDEMHKEAKKYKEALNNPESKLSLEMDSDVIKFLKTREEIKKGNPKAGIEYGKLLRKYNKNADYREEFNVRVRNTDDAKRYIELEKKVANMGGDPNKVDTQEEMTALLEDIKNDHRLSASTNTEIMAAVAELNEALNHTTGNGLAKVVQTLEKISKKIATQPSFASTQAI